MDEVSWFPGAAVGMGDRFLFRGDTLGDRIKLWSLHSPKSGPPARLRRPRAIITAGFPRPNGWRYCFSFGRWPTRRAMPLPQDGRQFIESLNSSGVEYLVVGAVAKCQSPYCLAAKFPAFFTND